MFIAKAPAPENQAPSGAACRIGDQTNGSMPLLTILRKSLLVPVPINMPLLRSLGDRAARVAINMPLLRSWWGSGGTVAINMPLVTELSGAARRP